MICLDLSADFDTVDHQILVDVLHKHFAVTDTALQWFKSYLFPRWCKVSISDVFSNSKNLEYSVPQGGLCGPVLYSCYASSIQNVVPNSLDLHGYADDHALEKAFKLTDPNSVKETLELLTDTTNDIKCWMNKNRLKMTNSKTELNIFTSPRMSSKCQIYGIEVDDSFIDRSPCIRYLGFYLNQNLSMNKHSNVKCRSAMSNLRKIRTIRDYLTMDACKTMIQGLVISYLDYANAMHCLVE